MKILRMVLGLALFGMGLATVTVGDAAPAASGPATTTAASTMKGNVGYRGVSDSATRVVYIVDHSGSLLDVFDFIRDDLKKSIAGLGAEQRVNVLMLSEKSEALGPKTELTPATKDTLKDFATKLGDMRAVGQNDDMLHPFDEAFILAFAMRAQVIFFATDGQFDPKLMDVITKLNKDKKVRVNVIDYSVMNTRNKEEMKRINMCRGWLQAIAKDSGGVYELVEQDTTKGK